MKVQHRPGRGCPCDSCEKRRAYAKRYYHEKKQGLPRNRATGETFVTTRNTEAKNQEPRLVESAGADGTVFHWMPKEGSEWKCPQCGNEFANLDGTWAAVA